MWNLARSQTCDGMQCVDMCWHAAPGVPSPLKSNYNVWLCHCTVRNTGATAWLHKILPLETKGCAKNGRIGPTMDWICRQKSKAWAVMEQRKAVPEKTDGLMFMTWRCVAGPWPSQDLWGWVPRFVQGSRVRVQSQPDPCQGSKLGSHHLYGRFAITNCNPIPF